MPPARLLAALKWAFLVAMTAAFATAISPLAPNTHVENGDKILHILAFYGLTLLGLTAYPTGRWWVFLIGMSAFGALIELVQGMPIIGRDREFLDWVADTTATAAAVTPLFIAPWRARWARTAA